MKVYRNLFLNLGNYKYTQVLAKFPPKNLQHTFDYTLIIENKKPHGLWHR